MSNFKLPETIFLDKYRKGALFLERYERRKATDDLTIIHDQMRDFHLENMENVKETIAAVKHEPYRDLLFYRYVMLFDYKTIGKLVNKTPENVQRQIYRAVHQIKIKEISSL